MGHAPSQEISFASVKKEARILFQQADYQVVNGSTAPTRLQVKQRIERWYISYFGDIEQLKRLWNGHWNENNRCL